MAATVDDYINAFCPKLDVSPVKDVYVESATALTSIAYFGLLYERAVALRACHDFTLDSTRPDGSSGQVTSKTEGRLSIHYWNPNPEGSYTDLHMTHYGKRLLALMHAIGPSASVSHPGINPDSGITLDPDDIYVF